MTREERHAVAFLRGTLHAKRCWYQRRWIRRARCRRREHRALMDVSATPRSSLVIGELCLAQLDLAVFVSGEEPDSYGIDAIIDRTSLLLCETRLQLGRERNLV